MTDISPEQISALAALGRSSVLPNMKMTRESQVARQAFEAFLDYLDWLGTNPRQEDTDPRLRDVGRTFARLSGAEQDAQLQAFAMYLITMMEATSQEASYVALQVALRFIFAIGWVIVPSGDRR